jgi:hypothetical protein
MRRSGCFLVATALITASSLAARADTISTFSLTNFTFTTGGSATGTVTIDTTTGISPGADITFVLGSLDEHFTEVFAQGFIGVTHELDYQDEAGDLFIIPLPESSLVGYAGSIVCSIDALSSRANCNRAVGDIYGPNGEYDFQSGALTFDSSTTTPEPTSLVLLGTGLLGAVGAIRRKLFKA